MPCKKSAVGWLLAILAAAIPTCTATIQSWLPCLLYNTNTPQLVCHDWTNGIPFLDLPQVQLICVKLKWWVAHHYMEVSQNRGTPSHHPNFSVIFPEINPSNSWDETDPTTTRHIFSRRQPPGRREGVPGCGSVTRWTLDGFHRTPTAGWFIDVYFTENPQGKTGGFGGYQPLNLRTSPNEKWIPLELRPEFSNHMDDN